MNRLNLVLILLYFFVNVFGQSHNTKGHNYAIFFYNTVFDDSSWPYLVETETDVKAIAAELKDNYNFQVDIVPNPTRQQIRDKITYWNNQVKPDDQVVFYFSTHGIYDTNSDEGFLIPRDGKAVDLYGDTWLSYTELGRRITLSKSNHLLLALDACYSGAFGIRERGKPENVPGNSSLDCSEQVNHAMAYKSRLYFCSGSKDQRTPARSLFAARWLEALRNGAESGLIRSNDLRYFLGKVEYPKPVNGTFTGHAPGGDFVFIHKSGCPSINTQTPHAPTIQEQENMVLIKGGSFDMGDPLLNAYPKSKPVHRVNVGDFLLSRYEVTVGEFARFIEATDYVTDAEKKGKTTIWNHGATPESPGVNWRHDPTGMRIEPYNFDHPVIHVSWNDAIAYCNWLSKREGLTPVYSIVDSLVQANWQANGFRLPTEAEWEFAARNRGEERIYASGSGRSVNANVGDRDGNDEFIFWRNSLSYNYKEYWDKSDGYTYTAPVGQFAQGDLGLFDMTGNVEEWCWDWMDHDYYANSNNFTNPKGPDQGIHRAARGGSFFSSRKMSRCAYRSAGEPNATFYDRGFRVCRNPW